MNCGPPDHLAPCFFDLNWDRPMGGSEGLAVSEVVGPLGGLSNPTGEISSHSQYMNSSPKLHHSMMNHQLGRVPPMPVPHLAPFPADPGFVERATRFFIGGGRHLGGLPEGGKLSRAPSGHSLGAQLEIGNPELGNAREEEESSASDPLSVGETNARKRKAAPKGKGKDPPISLTKQSTEGDGIGSNAKRCRSAESTKSENDEVKPKMEQSGGEDDGKKQHQKENNAAKPTEPPKDYIHVRARRGQATDSHSLAERVRRERISERMKLLQDLVPGCNKVTGRALMLDEIINYVQSLQRQVEFLSMKLASVNPQLDFNVESILPKDMHQTSVPLPNSVYPLEASAAAFPFAHQPHQGTPLQCVVTNGLESQSSFSQLETTLHRTLGMQLPSLDGFGDATTQLGTFWGDDLHHVVQMGYGQSQEMAFPSQNFHDPSPASHMKIEL